MSYTVTLTRQLSLTSDPALQPAPTRLIIQVTGVTDYPDFGIFTFSIDPYITGREQYSHVATPTDLQNYYLDTVGDNPFVRRSQLVLDFERADIAENFYNSVIISIGALNDDMDALTALGTPTTVVVD